jgi:hypothetical protein
MGAEGTTEGGFLMHRTRGTDCGPTDDADEPIKEDEDEDSQRSDSGELDGLGQAGTSEPQPGVGEYQGGGIEGAVGGGQSGQGGG